MKKYPLIDVLRGVAALLVVFYHVIEVGEWKSFPISGFALLPRIGWVGVDLFFVISGFVIGKTAMEGFARGGDWRAAYAERRIRRILPLYLATLAIYLFLIQPGLLLAGWNSLVHIGMHLLFVHNFWPETHGSINGPNWSVALEMQFYALMFFAAPWLSRSSWVKVLIVWVGVAVAWRFGTTLVWPAGSVSPHVQMIASTQLPGVLDQFAAGIALAKLASLGHLNYTRVRMLTWGVAGAVLLGTAWLLLWPRASYWNFPLMVIFWRTLLSAGFAALLACAIMCPMSKLVSVLSKPFRYLGEISYGIYLWHLIVLSALFKLTPLRDASLLFATVAITVVLAAMSWHGFEKLWLKPRASDKNRPAALGA